MIVIEPVKRVFCVAKDKGPEGEDVPSLIPHKEVTKRSEPQNKVKHGQDRQAYKEFFFVRRDIHEWE